MKYLLGILSALLIFFSLVMLFDQEESLHLTTSPKIYSIKKTSETEVFHIEVLSNIHDPYYLKKESIVSISLTDDEERIPLVLKELKVTQANSEDYIADFSLQVSFDANDYRIVFDQAYLDITYSNGQELSLYIGEFNYMFETSDTSLTYQSVYGTYGYVDGKNTVTAIVLELENNADKNILITNIDIFSNSVNIHSQNITETHQTIEPFILVQDILQEDYNFFDIDQDQVSIYMQTKEKKALYCPLLYNGDIRYIHRFVIEVTYIENNQEKTLIIDDFPFMKTSIFATEFEQGYHTYEID